MSRHDLILKALRASLDDHQLIGLHTNPGDVTRFSLGWITALTDEGYCLKSIDELGGPDGFQVGYISQIIKVSRGGPYFENIQTLVSSNVAFSASFEDYAIADLNEALKDIRKRQIAVTLVDDDRMTVTGIIEDLTDNCVEVHVYDKVGGYEGHEILRIDNLVRLEFLGRRELVLQTLLRPPSR